MAVDAADGTLPPPPARADSVEVLTETERAERVLMSASLPDTEDFLKCALTEYVETMALRLASQRAQLEAIKVEQSQGQTQFETCIEGILEAVRSPQGGAVASVIDRGRHDRQEREDHIQVVTQAVVHRPPSSTSAPFPLSSAGASSSSYTLARTNTGPDPGELKYHPERRLSCAQMTCAQMIVPLLLDARTLCRPVECNQAELVMFLLTRNPSTLVLVHAHCFCVVWRI